jgi:hypothetical protein
MSKEQPRVPGTRDPRPNRERRRHPDGGNNPPERPAADAPPPPEPRADAADPRAKSTGHGKKTADKWNQ